MKSSTFLVQSPAGNILFGLLLVVTFSIPTFFAIRGYLKAPPPGVARDNQPFFLITMIGFMLFGLSVATKRYYVTIDPVARTVTWYSQTLGISYGTSTWGDVDLRSIEVVRSLAPHGSMYFRSTYLCGPKGRRIILEDDFDRGKDSDIRRGIAALHLPESIVQ